VPTDLKATWKVTLQAAPVKSSSSLLMEFFDSKLSPHPIFSKEDTTKDVFHYW